MKKTFKILSILYLLFIVYYSIKPITSDSIISQYKLTDSGMIFHLAGYLVLSSVLFLSFSDRISIVRVFFLCLGLSVFLELTQIFIEYRNFNYFDIIGNVIGLFSFLCIFTLLNKFYPTLIKNN